MAIDIGDLGVEMNAAGYYPARAKRRWCLSADLGQANDSTALSVIEFVQVPMEPVAGTDWMDTACRQRLTPPEYNVRHLERLKIGMSYVDQVDYIATLLAKAPLVDPRALFAIDKSSIGRPVFDMFRARGLKPIGFTITGGRTDTTDDTGGFHVCKINLIGRLQTLFHTKHLHVSPALKEGPTFVKELQSFAASVSENGALSFSARSGQHDDILLSVAIGCEALHGPSGTGWASQQFLV
jgi:hypothetical protein